MDGGHGEWKEVLCFLAISVNVKSEGNIGFCSGFRQFRSGFGKRGKRLYRGTQIGVSSDWKYADFSKIKSGSAVLYKTASSSRRCFASAHPSSSSMAPRQTAEEQLNRFGINWRRYNHVRERYFDGKVKDSDRENDPPAPDGSPNEGIMLSIAHFS